MPSRKPQQPEVVLYSRDSCTWCYRLKTYLSRNNVKYREIDIEKNPEAAEALRRSHNLEGAPLTMIGETVVSGFDSDAINELLGLK